MSLLVQYKRTNSLLLVASLASVGLLALAFREFRRRQESDSNSEIRNYLGCDSLDNNITLTNQFKKAAEQMRLRSFASGINLKSHDKLILYGLYKQVTVGDAPHTMPKPKTWNIMEETAKYMAWCKLRSMPREAAALNYIEMVESFKDIMDWEKQDDEYDDDDNDDVGNGMGPGAVSRPVELLSENDHYDDAVGADGNSSDESQLLRAASENDIRTIHRILQQSNSVVTVDHADPTGQTALHLAADKGSLDAVQVLIEQYHANVNSVDKDGISILQAAVIAGRVTVCEWLLQNTDVNPDQADNDGDTPRSCAQDDEAMLQLFAPK
jgi:acyl-CoA-binding protein